MVIIYATNTHTHTHTHTHIAYIQTQTQTHAGTGTDTNTEKDIDKGTHTYIPTKALQSAVVHKHEVLTSIVVSDASWCMCLLMLSSRKKQNKNTVLVPITPF